MNFPHPSLRTQLTKVSVVSVLQKKKLRLEKTKEPTDHRISK